MSSKPGGFLGSFCLGSRDGLMNVLEGVLVAGFFLAYADAFGINGVFEKLLQKVKKKKELEKLFKQNYELLLKKS